MKMTRFSHYKIAALNGVFYLLFVVVLGLFAALAHHYRYQADWTFGNRNTLSESTQQLLQNLQQPLQFVAYVADRGSIEQDLKRHVEKYKRFKTDTELVIVNPELAPERAKKDGIQHQGQVLVRVGNRQEVIDTLAEQTVANVLQRLARDGQREVIFLEGHKERQPLATNSAGMSTLTQALQAKGFHFQPHHLLRSTTIPDNTQFLVIASPQVEVTEGEVDIIKQYLQQGGNLLWLHEPGSLYGLGALEVLLGIMINEGTVVDSNEALRKALGIKHPAVVPVIDYNGAEIARGMDTHTLFPLATSLERDGQVENDWEYQDFLLTLPSAWLEVDELKGNVVYEPSEGDISGPLSLGMTMTRSVKKTNGKVKQQRVVVVGDSDFMLNAFIGQVGNLSLSTAIFNWLANDDNLVAITATGAPDTRLALSASWLYGLGLLFLFIMPSLLLLLGIGIWLRRRKR